MAYIGKSPSTGIRNRFIYTATAGQTTFSGTDDHNRTLSYTDAEFTDVFLNGVKLDKSDYTATSGTSIVLDSGATVGDTLEILGFDTFSVFSGDFSQDVTIGGSATVSGDLTISDKIVHSGDANTAIRFASADTVTIETAGSERVRVDSSGNVGINTSSAAQKLHLQTGGTTYMRSENTGISTVTDFGTDSTGSIIINRSAKPMRFFTDSAERVRIDSSGNVLIADTTNVGTGDHHVSIQKGSSGRCLGLGTTVTTATVMMSLVNGNGTVGTIQTNGSATSYVTSSDYRLKENVTGITDGITRVKQLNPSRFNFIADPDTTVDGFLAHEAQTVVPEAITGEKDAMRDEEYEVTPATGDIFTPASAATDEVVHSTNVGQPDELADGQEWRETAAAVMGTRSVPDYQGIDQAKLVPLLTAALQEAIGKIEALETRVAALEA